MTENSNNSNSNTLTENKKIYQKKIVLLGLFLLLLALRLIYLDADPSFIKRVSDIGDEGIWVHNTRTLFLFDNIATDDATQSLSVSPLNTLLQIISFKFLGVNSFAARLPSALAGWFTLIILYFFLKKAWGKKAAFLSLLVLGLNETFLIYNKIALGLSLEVMFILLSLFFWYKGKDKKYWYLFAGIMFSFAILSKLSAYYLTLIFLVLWCLEKYRKETTFISLFLFGIGVIFMLIPYGLFLYTNWGILSANFLVLMKYYNSNGIVIFNFFRVFANNLFGLPGVFFLIVFSTVYFCTENKLKKIRTMDKLELISCCWLIVGLILLIVLSDLSDRRFFSLLIPMAILSTKVFLEKIGTEKKQIIFEKKEPKQYNSNNWLKNSAYAFIFSYPLTSFIVSGLSLSFCSPISICNSKQMYMLGLFIIIFSIGLLVLKYTNGAINNYLRRYYIQWGIFLFLLLPFSTLTRHFAHHISILRSTLNNEKTYIIITITIILFFYFIYHILSLYTNRLNKIKNSDIKKIMILYFIISSILISITFISPSFSAKENSQSLIPLIEKNKASGFLVQSLAFDAAYLPILIYKEGSFKEVNGQYNMSDIKYIFNREIIDGKPVTEPNDLTSFYKSSHLVKKLYLYPYPFTNISRIVISIYEVNNYKENQIITKKNEKNKPELE